MKLIIIIMALVVITTVSAYNIKYYQPTINQTEVNNFLNTIDKEYFEGIKLIRFYNSIHFKCGYYVVSRIILININSEKCIDYEEIIYHELKHHYCFKKEGYLSYDNVNHKGCFTEEIGLGYY